MNESFYYKLVIASVIIIIPIVAILGSLFKIMRWLGVNEMLIFSILGVLILFGVTLYDMILSPIRKKVIWIITLFFAPLLVGLLYTFLRNDMLENRVDYQ